MSPVLFSGLGFFVFGLFGAAVVDFVENRLRGLSLNLLRLHVHCFCACHPTMCSMSFKVVDHSYISIPEVRRLVRGHRTRIEVDTRRDDAIRCNTDKRKTVSIRIHEFTIQYIHRNLSFPGSDHEKHGDARRLLEAKTRSMRDKENRYFDTVRSIIPGVSKLSKVCFVGCVLHSGVSAYQTLFVTFGRTTRISGVTKLNRDSYVSCDRVNYRT